MYTTYSLYSFLRSTFAVIFLTLDTAYDDPFIHAALKRRKRGSNGCSGRSCLFSHSLFYPTDNIMSDQDKDLQKPDATEERTSASPRDKSSPSSPGPDAENTNRVGNASPTEHVSDVTHEAHEQSEQQKSRQDQGQQQQQQQQTQLENLRPPVRTLKEAFPDVDVEVIEAILESQRGHVEPSFEILLGMSDPSYQPEMPPRPTSQAPPAAAARQTQHTAADDVPAPPMPPRPTGNYDQYGNFQQAHREPRSVEEQMRMDEEYARQIALEEERLRMQQYQRKILW